MKGRRRAIILLLLGAACVLLAAAAWLLVARLEWPGGIRSDYQARDGDPRLTEIARTASSVVAAIERHRDRSGSLPDALDELGLDESSGWSYVRTATDSYQLARKLGWDTALVYERHAERSTWMFAPGDGRPDLMIVLDP